MPKPSPETATETFAAAPILPGAVLGVVGGGQLGRMFAIAARQMGYRVWVLTDQSEGPASSCADLTIVAQYDDVAAIDRFVAGIQAVTFETEKLPIDLFHRLSRSVPVRPGIPFLYLSQNRIREKMGLQAAGLPVGPCEPVHGIDDLRRAVDALGRPCILKTAEGGYDGRGQIAIHESSDLAAVWKELDCTPAILEAFIDFECEVSVLAARDVFGRIETYGPIRNQHRNHILDLSSYPANLPEVVEARTLQITTQVAQAFDVVGVFCIEFFVCRDQTVLINEIAPRPHNSGHLTIEGHATSQFQQQVRCLCGLPLGSAQAHGPVAMANLLGNLWQEQIPNWERALQDPEVQLHLYGKEQARVGRKMGHLTARGPNLPSAIRSITAARENLSQPKPGLD